MAFVYERLLRLMGMQKEKKSLKERADFTFPRDYGTVIISYKRHIQYSL